MRCGGSHRCRILRRMAFTVDVDIANRALQHCGEPRIDTTLGFTEVSQRAQEKQSAYGKIKRAPLLRSDSVWTFATRRAPLRPIDTNTMVVAPAMWGLNDVHLFPRLARHRQYRLRLAVEGPKQPQ